LTHSALTRHKIIPSTPFGEVVIVWTVFEKRPKVVRIFLSKPGLAAQKHLSVFFPDSKILSCNEIDGLSKRIEAFLNGDSVHFSLDIARLDLCSRFQRSVLRVEHRVPRGKVTTYRLIAAHLGQANGARAVGNALSKNPFPILVPCHRAIRSDGSLGGYQGGLEMKGALLRAEGIRFDSRVPVLSSELYNRFASPVKRRRNEGGV